MKVNRPVEESSEYSDAVLGTNSRAGSVADLEKETRE